MGIVREKNIKENSKFLPGVIFLTVLLIVSVILGLMFGSVKISLNQILMSLTGADLTSAQAVIIREVRLTRVLSGIIAGTGLSVAGVILQSVMNNVLASPNTIGVNSGAGFAVMLSMVIFPRNIILQPVMAFAGALVTSVLIFLLAYLADSSRTTIILAGITVSSFLSGGINLMKTLNTDLAININSFLVGSLSGLSRQSIIWPGILTFIAFIFAMFLSNWINILGLGDEVARSLGLRVNATRFILLIISSILAGCTVSFAGLLSFVGLIVPHICRRLFGNDAKILIPSSALLGASFVILCDLIGRTVFAPYELPVGIILSLIGGPFFLYLLLKKKGGRRIHA